MYYKKYIKYKNKYFNLLLMNGGTQYCNREQKIKCRESLIKCNNDNEFKKFVSENIVQKDGKKYINIELILFSQNTINIRINTPKKLKLKLTIKDIFESLITGSLKIEDISYIHVNPIKHNDKYYFLSKDNRRLAIFNAYYKYLKTLNSEAELLIPVNFDFCITQQNLDPICSVSDAEYTCDYGYFYDEILNDKKEFHIKDFLIYST
jgi:hypothetical protein